MKAVYPRCLRERLEKALARRPVVVLLGARRVGKSHLLQKLARRRGVRPVDLADPATLEEARADPSRFLAGLRLPAAVDGVERFPGLLSVLARRVVEGAPAGAFLLAASGVFPALSRLIRALGQQVQVLTLEPLTLAERHGACFNLFGRLEDPPSGPAPESWETPYSTGGLPELLPLARHEREEWWRSHLQVAEGRARPRRAEGERPLLALLAREGPGLLNLSAWARQLGRSQPWVTKTLERLENRGWVVRIPAWAPPGEKGLARQDRVLLFDTGLINHLTDTRYAGERGRAFRVFALTELLRHAGFAGLRPHHLRGYKGQAVDLVLTRPDGRLLAFALRFTQNPTPADLGDLPWLKKRLGDRLASGYLVHAGEEVVDLEGFLAVPARVLWP